MECSEFYKMTEMIASKYQEANSNRLSFFSGKSEAYKFALTDALRSMNRVCHNYMEKTKQKHTKSEYGILIYEEYYKFGSEE